MTSAGFWKIMYLGNQVKQSHFVHYCTVNKGKNNNRNWRYNLGFTRAKRHSIFYTVLMSTVIPS